MKDKKRTKEQLMQETTHLRRRLSELETIEAECTDALEELQESEKRFKDIAENAQEWIWEVDKNGKYTYSSPAVEKILGYKPHEVLNKYFFDLFHPEDRDELKARAFEQFNQKEAFREFINRNVHKNGKTVWLSTSGVPVLDEQGNLVGYRGADTDVTELKEMVEALRESDEICRLVTQSATDAVLLINNSEEILLWNRSAEDMFGYSADEAIGKSLTIIMPERFTAAHKKGMRRYLFKDESRTIGRDYELTGRRKDGSEFPVEISLSGWERKGEIFFTGVIRDITERKKMEEKLRNASITDELTGLLNRRGFLTVAQKQIEIADRTKRGFSLLYLDLNDMKMINDELGHREGDQALMDIATILEKTFRASDLIARVGGDEFVVLFTESRTSSVEKAVMKSMQDNLRIHNEEAGKEYILSVSTGMVQYDPAHPCTVEEVLSRADDFMYENKQRHQLEKAGLRNVKKVKREKRIGKRFKLEKHCNVELVVPDYGRIKDISMNGICLQTPQRLAKNTVYSIRVFSPSPHTGIEEIRLTGLVVWSSLQGETNELDNEARCYEAGLRFIEVTDKEMSSLKTFIAGCA